jgi:CIC family chloride channel protein
LETIRERHIDLILMGWQGELSTKERIFGDVVDTVIRQAGCEVVLVKWSEKLLAKRKKNEFSATFSGRKYASIEWELNPEKVDGADNPALARSSDSSATPETELSPPNSDIPGPELGLHTLMGLQRWLVPIRGGYKQAAALRLLPALVAASAVPQIKLCQVHQSSVAEPDRRELKQAAEFIQRRVSCSIIATSVCAQSVSDALIDLAQNDQCDAIVLGASREGLLKQVIQGNIPEAVARGCDCTVILVRSAN